MQDITKRNRELGLRHIHAITAKKLACIHIRYAFTSWPGSIWLKLERAIEVNHEDEAMSTACNIFSAAGAGVKGSTVLHFGRAVSNINSSTLR